VMLGLAGYGEVYFDDFNVQVIEQETAPASPEVAGTRPRGRTGTSPGLPDPRLPRASAARSAESRRQQR